MHELVLYLEIYTGLPTPSLEESQTYMPRKEMLWSLQDAGEASSGGRNKSQGRLRGGNQSLQRSLKDAFLCGGLGEHVLGQWNNLSTTKCRTQEHTESLWDRAWSPTYLELFGAGVVGEAIHHGSESPVCSC